jgi:succinoglycan biosynthesis protein ExoL
MVDAAGLRVVVFGFDVAEISQIRRIRALRDAGYRVESFTMRRDNMNAGFVPDWPNTHLFETRNERPLERAAVVAKSVLKMARHRSALARADVIVARNLDMLAIAVAARRLAGAARGAGRAPIVYECLDIHGMMTGTGAKGRAARALERRLLAACDLLVVSSPGFIHHYFDPVQKYDGPWALWENKLVRGEGFPARPDPGARGAPQGPLRLGWIGTIRCAPSLALLAETAQAMAPGLEVHVHGVVHRHAVPDFDAVVAAHPNMHYHGPYDYPGDLPRIYGMCDLVWAQDLWQRGTNSDWLLPNRIYEASWCGCPSVAVAGTETGRRIARDGLGPVIDAPRPADLAAGLQDLSPARLRAWSDDLLARPDTDFVQSPADLHRVIRRAAGLESPDDGGARPAAGQGA